jgi:hypothetical protein
MLGTLPLFGRLPLGDGLARTRYCLKFESGIRKKVVVVQIEDWLVAVLLSRVAVQEIQEILLVHIHRLRHGRGDLGLHL